MLEWIEKISNSYVEDNSVSPVGPMKIRSITDIPSHKGGINLSPLTQTFLAPYIATDPNVVTYLPVRDEEVLNKIINELGVHFKSVKGVYFGETLFQVILQGIRDNSVELFKTMQLHQEIEPVVESLYFNNVFQKGETSTSNMVDYYMINPKLITPVHSETFSTAWEFIYHNFKPDGRITLTPSNWSLIEELNESFAIRYFSHQCEKVVLVVDSTTSKIINLDLILK